MSADGFPRGGNAPVSKHKVRRLFSLSGLIVIAILVYVLVPKETVDEVAAHSGAVGRVIPWADRTESALRRLMDGPSGAAAARSIQNITHPTGDSARLRAYEVRRTSSTICVRISTSWQGGFTGTDYTTDIVWEFGETRHISATVISDDALVGVSDEAARHLDDYFRLEFYPVLCSNAGT